MRENEVFTTVAAHARAEFFEKNSRFIGHILPVREEEEALTFVRQIKKEYHDATHNVFAYISADGAAARFSDDGEPKGTAGLPVLEAIKKSGVFGACIVVTRYFGGTLLGAGGLVRAYGRAAHEAISAAGIVTYEKFGVFELVCSYASYQKYAALFPEYRIIIDGTDFSDKVKVTLAVNAADTEAFGAKITETGGGRDALKKLSERFDSISKPVSKD